MVENAAMYFRTFDCRTRSVERVVCGIEPDRDSWLLWITSSGSVSYRSERLDSEVLLHA